MLRSPRLLLISSSPGILPSEALWPCRCLNWGSCLLIITCIFCIWGSLLLTYWGWSEWWCVLEVSEIMRGKSLLWRSIGLTLELEILLPLHHSLIWDERLWCSCLLCLLNLWLSSLRTRRECVRRRLWNWPPSCHGFDLLYL